jgi:indolepyruvate ferredoxin oxidoreductase
VHALPLDDLRLSRDPGELISRRIEQLTAWQNAAYADRYRDLVERVHAAEKQRTPGRTELTEAVARYAYKLMAYKDEYEVARLYSNGEFRRRIEQAFEGNYTLRLHLAPPLLARKDENGHLVKKEYGAWMLRAFGLLARLKGLRGTVFDVFGYSAERRMERALIGEYTAMVEELITSLDADNHALAVELAQIPEHIRGFGHVKEAHLARARARWTELLARWRQPAQAPRAAA